MRYRFFAHLLLCPAKRGLTGRGGRCEELYLGTLHISYLEDGTARPWVEEVFETELPASNNMKWLQLLLQAYPQNIKQGRTMMPNNMGLLDIINRFNIIILLASVMFSVPYRLRINPRMVVFAIYRQGYN